MKNATPPVLSSAAALPDGIFEHPVKFFWCRATRRDPPKFSRAERRFRLYQRQKTCKMKHLR